MAFVARRIGGLANRFATALTSPIGLITAGTIGATTIASVSYYADSKDFFVYKFRTTKDPDAVVDFYSTEDFLEILGIFPFAIRFVLAGVTWDDKKEQTMNVWESMQISFDITEKEEIIDGKEVVTFFNKRERFVNYIPATRILIWDQVQNYGYRRLPDGSLEVSHQGESFYGPWPVRLIVSLHALYVIWATEKHINSPIFGNNTEEGLEAQHHQRSNIPMLVASEWLNTVIKGQEAAVKTGKLKRHNTAAAEANLAELQKLAKMDVDINLDRRRDGTVKVNVKDPHVQAAIKSALQDIKKQDGADAAAAALDSLLKDERLLKKAAA